MRSFLIQHWVEFTCVVIGFWVPGLVAGLELPPDVPFNVSAGHEDFLYITLQSESGERWLFYVDSGSSCTILDKSLEPKLGKSFGPGQTWGWEGIRAAGVYAAPHLYIRETRLRTGHLIKTQDLKRMFPGHPVMGILGMDCLKHYCIQLDFASNKLSFLDPQDSNVGELGDAFPLKMFLGMVWTRMDLLGIKARPFLDFGDPSDGALKAGIFDQMLGEPGIMRTNDASTLLGRPWRDLRLASGQIAGHTYSNLTFWRCSRSWLPQNEIGLGFLARHIVTLNFPKRKMYLRPQEVRPGADQGRPTLAWWMTERPGFQDSEWLGKRIISAPNLHPVEKADAADELTLWWDARCFVDVGAPDARLSIAQIPASDYHLRAESELKPAAVGPQKVFYSLQVEGSRATRSVPEVGTVLLLHDYNQRKEYLKAWAYVLAQAGYRTVLVDLRGHGLSSGDTIGFGRYETGDLSQLLDVLQKRQGASQDVGVVGVGYGAGVALHWAARDPRVATVVAIAPCDTVEQALEKMAETAGHPVESVILQRALEHTAQQLGINWSDWSGAAALRRLSKPVLLVGGDSDRLSTPDDLSRLQQCAPPGSRKFIVRGANHVDLPNCFRELSKPVTDWFDTHLAHHKSTVARDSKCHEL